MPTWTLLTTDGTYVNNESWANLTKLGVEWTRVADIATGSTFEVVTSATINVTSGTGAVINVVGQTWTAGDFATAVVIVDDQGGTLGAVTATLINVNPAAANNDLVIDWANAVTTGDGRITYTIYRPLNP
jgi:fumarylacetoacetate (FAA) hydrolase family protein